MLKEIVGVSQPPNTQTPPIKLYAEFSQVLDPPPALIKG